MDSPHIVCAGNHQGVVTPVEEECRLLGVLLFSENRAVGGGGGRVWAGAVACRQLSSVQ